MSEAPKKVRNALVKLPPDPAKDQSDKPHIQQVQFSHAAGPSALTAASDHHNEIVVDTAAQLVHVRHRSGMRTFSVPLSHVLWFELRA